MAKKATGKGSKGKAAGSARPKSAVSAERRENSGGRRSSDTTGEAFIKLLQSPFVAELVAVAATAALAALAEHGVSSRGAAGTTGRRAGRAVKAAGAAAAAAVGRRLTNEIDEIRRAAKEAKSGAKA
jgi:hypothetical protein